MKLIKLIKLNNPTYRALTKAYSKSIRDSIYYYKNNLLEPHDVKNAHRFALYSLREYLNSIGCAMPEPLYKYDPKKSSTCKYVMTTKTGHGDYSLTASNPSFAYDRTIFGKDIN